MSTAYPLPRKVKRFMSWVYSRPLRLAGANVNSGNVNTGDVQYSRGGLQAMSIYSGMASGVSLAAAVANAGNAVAVGADVLLVSGAGKIKDVILHQQQLSGLGITFYDAGIVASGGPFVSSGTKVVAIIPAGTTFITTASGLYQPLGNSQVFNFDKPFQSGLCVNLKSGQPGFTVDFVVETNPTGAYN